MAKGMPGADSSTLVTSLIGGKNLVDLAKDLFRPQMPVVWGRYFTSATTSGTVEYRHLKENQLLRDNNIRVLPIARQTKRVNGSAADGSADATANAEDLIQTFSADYLATQGGRVVMFLDVEGAPSLSVGYYQGWAGTLLTHSKNFSNGKVTILPCVYGTRFDDATWQAVVDAVRHPGVEFHGAWIARWRVRGCGELLDFDEGLVRPNVFPASFKVLLWQYGDDCHGPDGFDLDETNPAIDLQQDLLSKCILPPETPMS